MQTSAIRLFKNNIPHLHIKTNSSNNTKNSSINNTTNNCIIGKNYIPNISFGSTLIKRYMNENQDYLCKKFLEIHKTKANSINPDDVKKYFENLGIPYNIKMQSEKANKIIAYCCYNTNEIIRQMHLPMPSRIETERIDSDKYSRYITVATCSPFPDEDRGFPIGTISFNYYNDWENCMDDSYKEYQHFKFHTTGHFLHTFIHENGHNVHIDNLYSKFGCPFKNQKYRYNPHLSEKIIEILAIPINSNDGTANIDNKYVTKEGRKIINESSGYGKTKLNDYFAEEFSKAVLSCMDPVSLRLFANPKSFLKYNTRLCAIMKEIYDGELIDDKGYIQDSPNFWNKLINDKISRIKELFT